MRDDIMNCIALFQGLAYDIGKGTIVFKNVFNIIYIAYHYM